MWLVLCGINDLPALWAARGLAARGLKPLEIVSAEALAYNRRFVHSLTATDANVTIELADGRAIQSAAVRGTLNRLQSAPSEHMRTVPATDRRYAEQELYALFLSWLYCLPSPVLNKPTPQGLSGAQRHLSEWVWLAGQAGLQSMPYRQNDRQAAPLGQTLSYSATRTIIVVNDACCGAVAPPPVQQGCGRLAQLSGANLLGVDFQVTPSGQWLFTNATPLPDLRLGGEALLDTLFKFLQS